MDNNSLDEVSNISNSKLAKMKLMLWISGGLIVVVGVVFLCGYILFGNLPDDETIRSYQPKSTTYLMDVKNLQHFPGQPIRIWVPLSKISSNLQKAVLISEDDTFYQHDGINWTEMKKAFQRNLERRGYTRGASTITMQLARNAFLTREKTLLRKFREIILARRMEKLLSKRRIFELYLNIVEWGPNIYGAEAAARFYFGKPASALTLAEASLLAAMLPNPKRFNPMIRMNAVKKLQQRVLTLLRDARWITPEEFEMVLTEPIYLRGAYPEVQPLSNQPDSTNSVSEDSTLVPHDSTTNEI